MNKPESDLALFGGKRTRPARMPFRRAFGAPELAMVKKVFELARKTGIDFGYQEAFEKQYTDAFVRYQGGGFADAVSTGTAAVFIAVSALQLKPGSHVLVSPITDPGTLSAIIFNQLTPVLVDSMPNSYNMGVEQFVSRITKKTKGLVLVHASGRAAPVDKICAIARKKGIKVVEDCSQAHGANCNGKKIGTFGDIAAFSTMFRKVHATGGCGGVVYTRDRKLHLLARAYADRGKPFGTKFNDKDPTSFLFPALNFNLDELSCAIGLGSLKRLNRTIQRRLRFVFLLEKALKQHTKTCYSMPSNRHDSPFFQPIFVKTEKLRCSKMQFAEAVQAEGIDINPHYMYVVEEWPFMKPHLGDSFHCKNAKACRDQSFNLLLNENFDEAVVRDVVKTIQKIESVYLK
jgi:perosamine synthetase